MKVWVLDEEELDLDPKSAENTKPPGSHRRVRLLLGLFSLTAVFIVGWAVRLSFTEADLPAQSPPLLQSASLKVSAPPGWKPGSPVSGRLSRENRPPIIASVDIFPSKPYPGDEIQARVKVSDADGDPVMLSYIWLVNGEAIQETSVPLLSETVLQKNDSLTVKVVPWDGFSEGYPVTSWPVKIMNRPPQISSAPSTHVRDGVYIYEVEATDPDGDELKFRIAQGPEAMNIDANTGIIRWPVPSTLREVNVTVVASDGDGAEAFQLFRLFLQTGS